MGVTLEPQTLWLWAPCAVHGQRGAQGKQVTQPVAAAKFRSPEPRRFLPSVAQTIVLA